MASTFEDAPVLGEEAARRELWISFGSLIRAYVAGAQAGLEPPQVLVSQAGEDDLELVSSRRSIRLHLDPGEEAGYWVMYQAPDASDNTLLGEGAFRIGMDSLVEWTGLPGRQEMDAVAEALATLIVDE